MFSNTIKCPRQDLVPLPPLGTSQPFLTWPSFRSWCEPGRDSMYESAEATVAWGQHPLIFLCLGRGQLWEKEQGSALGVCGPRPSPSLTSLKEGPPRMSNPAARFAFSSGFSVNPARGHYSVHDPLVMGMTRLSSFFFTLRCFTPLYPMTLFCPWLQSLSKVKGWPRPKYQREKKKRIYLKNPLNQLCIVGNCLSRSPKSGIECTWDLKQKHLNIADNTVFHTGTDMKRRWRSKRVWKSRHRRGTTGHRAFKSKGVSHEAPGRCWVWVMSGKLTRGDEWEREHKYWFWHWT